MSNLILPGDPDYKQPLVMGDAYAQGLTPKTAQTKRNAELDAAREAEGANFKYANSTVAHAPDPWFTKMAQATGVSNMMSQPMWFSPLHTPQNWQIASKRREIYQWCRFFFENEPKVFAAINFYSRFPMNGFKLECEDRKILKYFEHHVVKRLDLNEQLKMISSEYFTLGDVFIHLDIDCPVCNGSAIDPGTGDACNHEGGSFKRLRVLNPDWIEVQQSVLVDEPSIVFVPDEEIKRIVFLKQPKQIYDKIPDAIKQLVLQNKPIPLSNRVTSHLKHMPVPYGTYGTSLIRCLFTTLAYKTKIMTANWIVAERLILPVRVVKIGSDNRPAASTDIADVQQQLNQTANDPNLTIVTHHNFEYEWYGASGKILQVTQEMEYVGKEILDGFMLNQSLLNGEMSGYQCHDVEQTEVLTRDGFKKYDDISIDDEIATFNKNTEILEYHPYIKRYSYEYDGEMYHFSNKRVDTFVTPNHRMLAKRKGKNEWEVINAEDLPANCQFRTVVKYKGRNAHPRKIRIDDEYSLNLEDYIKLVCFFATEGSIRRETRKERKTTCGQAVTTTIYQSEKGKAFTAIKELAGSVSYRVKHYAKYDQFCIHNRNLSNHLVEECGGHSENKRIPAWIKELPQKYLRLALDCLIMGDGYFGHPVKDGHQYGFEVKGKQLAEDVYELAWKCGYSPLLAKRKNRDLWSVDFSDAPRGKYPYIQSRYVNKVPYKGRVFCFTVPNGFFVTRRNGKIAIHGNSAQVGVETLIRRIESWRHTLGEWCENNIFKPVAEMQGFVDEKKSEEVGELCFMYPTIKWNDLKLKDPAPWWQLLNQLHDKQLISAQTLLEETDLNYDQEVKRMRYEQAQAGPMGAQMGAPGMGGDMGGGMDMGGGGGGAPPGGDMLGGEMGGMPGGDMGMGGGMGGAEMAPAASSGKIMKKGKESKIKEEQMEAMQVPPVKLTSIEQQMAGMIEEVAQLYKIGRQHIRAQFPVQNPDGGPPFQLDFAIPHLKLNVEADGEVWHSSQEQSTDDKERDYTLAQRGWTVLRFDDKAIEEAPQAIKNTIGKYMDLILKSKGQKTASVDKDKPAKLYTVSKGKLSEMDGEYDKFFKISHVSDTIGKTWSNVGEWKSKDGVFDQ